MLKAVANRAYKAIVACALGAAVVLAPAGASARQWQDAPVSSPIALAELPKVDDCRINQGKEVETLLINYLSPQVFWRSSMPRCANLRRKLTRQAI